MQPVFAPAGYDWKITVSVLASFPAREMMVSTLNIIYAVGDDDEGSNARLQDKMKAATWDDGRAIFSPVIAVSIMVFFALCMQCGSTVAVIVREVGWRWAVFAFVYMSGLAWVGAVAVTQLGTMFFGGYA